MDSSVLAQVIAAVKEAGRLLTDPNAVAEIRAKSVTDYVTNVDVAVQTQLKAKLAALTPDVQFMGEEQDNAGLDPHGSIWILDPVDGTTNLIHNFHFSAISLALYEGGQVVFGVVYHPYSDSCFTATRGGGSFLNGQPISVSSATQLRQCLASVGTVPGRRDLGETAFRQLWTLYNACQDVRRMGCASLDLSFVACGRQDLYVEPALKPWDYAAGQLIIREAGGVCTTMDGGRLCPLENADILVTNGLIHAQALSLLCGTEKGG